MKVREKSALQTALAVLLVFTLAVACAESRAQQPYPQRPVRIVVNVGAGGGVDSIARVVAQHYAAVWGQSFIVDNRPGAGGSIGAETVAKAAPDGYTLLVSSGSVITNAAVRPQGYDPVRDFQPITRLISSPYVIAATPSLPVSSIRDLVAMAKSAPSRVSFASSGGTGSITHLGPELLSLLAGATMVHIPYRGVGGAYPAVASGDANWVMGNPVSIMPMINSGRLKAIAVTSTTRLRNYPELPTVAESGVPGFEVVGWYGMFAPAGVPQEIAASLHSEARKRLQSAEIARRMEAESSEVVANAPREFASEVKAELEKWRDLVAKRGIKL